MAVDKVDADDLDVLDKSAITADDGTEAEEESGVEKDERRRAPQPDHRRSRAVDRSKGLPWIVVAGHRFGNRRDADGRDPSREKQAQSAGAGGGTLL